jgi:SAM-dependent methyltransferase
VTPDGYSNDALSVMRALRDGTELSDRAFDEALFPREVRRHSDAFWTPLEVVRRVIDLIVPSTSTRVLDVGSGAGKFCIVGAALTGATFVGIEHRLSLVEAATEAATLARTPGASFIHGDFRFVDVTSFDVFYFYNPFEENLLPLEQRIDATVPLSPAKFVGDVRRAESMLARARKGTCVAMYHGFKGAMPTQYRRIARESCRMGYIDVWVKR